jgi:hypothetical protein
MFRARSASSKFSERESSLRIAREFRFSICDANLVAEFTSIVDPR